MTYPGGGPRLIRLESIPIGWIGPEQDPGGSGPVTIPNGVSNPIEEVDL